MKKFLRFLKIVTIGFTSIVVLFILVTIIYMQQAKFGKAPSGEYLEQISVSSNFEDGIFLNLQFTPDLSEGYSYMDILYDQFFVDHPRTAPKDTIPSEKTDLFSLDKDENVLIWFGHSSYYIQLDGKKILVDPVFSGNASPIPGTVPSFPGTDRYTPDDMPEVDYLLISHDHYDHLDYETITALEGKVKQVICGLGVGSHFRHWGYADEKISEMDWNQVFEADSGFSIHTLPARHFSGRGFSAKNTLWASYLIESPSMKIYVGGDSGYGTFLTDIGNEFGPIDLAILDNGQYNDAWREIHLHPKEVLQAARDLKAKRLFPVHSSKFVLGMHPWDEPLNEVARLNRESENPISLFTPLIGEEVDLDNMDFPFSSWWEGID